MKRSIMTRSAAWTALLSFAVTSCSGKSGPVGPTPPPTTGSASPLSDKALVQLKDAPNGLDMRVSEGKQGAAAADRSKIAPAKKLPDAEANAILARARAITTDPDDTKAFALRPGSQPAPRTGTTIKGAFPPAISGVTPPVPASAETGKALRVLRYMPEGAVPIAPELSVTFSQPMVAVTSQGDAAGVQPVKLSPQPKGNWRWIGTRTLLFDPDVRFPMAQTYAVEVPKGTKSAIGGELAEATKFTFETPPPTVVQSYPNGGPHHLDVPMFVLFDQKIDATAVLSKIKVSASGAAIAVVKVEPAELEKALKDPKSHAFDVANLVERAKKNEQDGRWLAFRATSLLPTDAGFTVEIPAGTPSAEGPNTTKQAQSFSFRTYAPLKITKDECGYRGNCPPGTPYVIQLNNPLDVDKFEETQLTITPEIPGVRIMQSHSNLIVQGATEAQTTYNVVVSSGLRDHFGQLLGKDQALSFRVTDAVPNFFGPSGMVVVDPGAKTPTLDYFTTNYDQLKVRLYKVEPSDFDAYNFYIQNQWNRDKPPPVPGTKVTDALVATKGTKNKLLETSIDLQPALDKSGLGHAIAIVEPYPWTQRWEPPRMISWVQSTKLAIDAYVDSDSLNAFATELATGKPASGVALEIRPFGLKGATDEKGLATIALGAGGKRGAHHLIAKRGNDVAFVAEHGGWGGDYGSWVRSPRGSALAWYVIDDRKMYKPGEEVSLKGWLRSVDNGRGGDVGAATGVVSVKYKVHDSRGNEIAKGTAAVSNVGGFDTKFTLPKTPNLGHAYMQFEATGRTGGSYHHSFQIQEFRRPEFEVSAKASQGPFLVGAGGDVSVSAKYYSGGPLPGAPVNWSFTASQTSYTPPNRDEYVFGAWTPWWSYHEYDDDGTGGYYGRGYKPPKTWSLSSKTDATGAHVAHLDFLSVKPALPMSVSATANVTDVNRQMWSSSAALLVHPSNLYVGLKTKRPFVDKGVPFEVDVIGVDLDGKAAAGAAIEVKAVRLDWEYKKGKYTQKEVAPQTCAVTAAKDASPCKFATPEGGTYKVTATIVDDKGRPNQTSLTFWVAGGDRPAAREIKQERVQLIPDKKEYQAGQTAELLVQAPFYPAEAVVSWRRSGMVKMERHQITGPTKIITVPITEAMVPNMMVQVDLVGAAARTDDKGQPDAKLPKRPAYAVGQIDLPVPPKQRTLAVQVAPNAAKVGPGDTTKLELVVRDAAGRPVADAEAAVIVVDEAILSLSGYKFPDPVHVFYGHRAADVRDYYSQAYVKLAKPELDRLAENRAGNGGAVGGTMTADASATTPSPASVPPPPPPSPPGEAPKAAERASVTKSAPQGQPAQPPATGPIAIRSNFNPLAAFSPSVRTNAAGKATVDVKMPDNLTRYRIVAVATAGDKQFGKGESAVTARLPLMVRPSPPRFLNFGDTFQLPVVVQNQTDTAMTVKLAARTTNAQLTDGAGREVTVPANDRVEVLFPAAAELAGTARFQLVGNSGSYSDAAEVALPVWTPATTEAFATYGTIDGTGAAAVMKQPVALPGKVVTQFGGLEVTTASTNLQALTDALLYLVKYPYECAEQRASRILAIAALRDVLTAFKTKDLPSPAAMEASVVADVERLSQMQNGDGGFTWWERGYPSDPYLTVYVASALQHAKAKGFTVAQHVIDRAKPYLKDIERHYPPYYGPEIRRTISSFALYTRKQLGDLDLAKGQKLIAEAGGVEKLSMEANGWLLGTFAGQAAAATERKAIVRHASNKVSETAGAANFTTGYADGAHLLLASNRRVDAVFIESLIQEDQKHDLIPKLVTGLLAHRKAGRWLNTQENTFALLAMDLYFHTYEKATPDFVAKVWLGNDYAGEKAFKGRSTDYYAIPIPMKDVAAHDKQDLTIQKDGVGRLYYRIGMSYAPASLRLEPADYGFAVQRRYEAVDNPGDVKRDPDGTWRVKAGAKVRVKLTMVNENRRYHVALVDPMPAGFEAMNPALAVTGPVPRDPSESSKRGRYWWYQSTWYEHQNMRDERVEAFASLLWEGVHAYSYVARATTPGNFVVPPTKAEEMYMPETFGRSGSDRVVVE